MTISAVVGASEHDDASPYTVSPTVATAAGDLVVCVGAAFEFTAASPGSRTLSMASAGWTEIFVEEMQIYPWSPPDVNRRLIVGAWHKTAAGSSETPTIELSGATGAYLRLSGRATAVSGVADYQRQGDVTRVDSTSSPATFAADTPTTNIGEVCLLVHLAGFGGTSVPTGFTDLAGGNTGDDDVDFRLTYAEPTVPDPASFGAGTTWHVLRGIALSLPALASGWHIGSLRFGSTGPGW